MHCGGPVHSPEFNYSICPCHGLPLPRPSRRQATKDQQHIKHTVSGWTISLRNKAAHVCPTTPQSQQGRDASCTSGLFWEKMPMNLFPVLECPLWRRAEPMHSALSATCAQQRTVHQDGFLVPEDWVIRFDLSPLCKTATRKAAWVSSIPDKDRHLRRHADILSYQIKSNQGLFVCCFSYRKCSPRCLTKIKIKIKQRFLNLQVK